jgi:hypothetical protein
VREEGGFVSRERVEMSKATRLGSALMQLIKIQTNGPIKNNNNSLVADEKRSLIGDNTASELKVLAPWAERASHSSHSTADKPFNTHSLTDHLKQIHPLARQRV